VYGNKIFRRGAALKGFYSRIRHPQYASRAVAGPGLAVLWPRFIVLVLWLVMLLAYYFLSRDEERRMLRAYPGPYEAYMEKTGMFLPRGLEKKVKRLLPGAATFLLIPVFTLGGFFSQGIHPEARHLESGHHSMHMGGMETGTGFVPFEKKLDKSSRERYSSCMNNIDMKENG
jgi:hypothetical protein